MSDSYIPTPLFEQDFIAFQDQNNKTLAIIAEVLELDVGSDKDPTPKLRVEGIKVGGRRGPMFLIPRSEVLGVICPRCYRPGMMDMPGFLEAVEATYQVTSRIPDRLYRYGMPHQYRQETVTNVFRIHRPCNYMKKV